MSSIPTWVPIPHELAIYAGNVRDGAGLRLRVADGITSIAFEEIYQGQRIRALDHPVRLPITRPGGEPQWSRLAYLDDPPWQPGQREALRQRIQQELASLAASPSVASMNDALSLVVSTTDAADLPTVLRDHVIEWAAGSFPTASLHAIRLDRALSLRTRIPQVFTAILTYPELVTGGQAPTRFESMRGLTSVDHMMGAKPFLTPLILATAPVMHSMLMVRHGCAFILDLGYAIDGCQGRGASLLDRYMPTFPARARTAPPLATVGPTEVDRDSACSWWISRLNDMFHTILNPARFTQNGMYAPQVHMATLLGLINLFEYVSQLRSRAGRDPLGRRTLCFIALDTLEGLHYLAAAQTLNPSRAARVLAEVTAVIPAEAAAVLLPVPTRAVRALDNHRSGFVIPSWQGQQQIRVPGATQPITIDRLVASHLRAVRNGQHSYRKVMQAGNDDGALLTAHYGDVDDTIADLPFLYLLHILVDPTRIIPKHLR